MKIAVDFGHGTGEDRGASGYLNEEAVVRSYGPLVIAGLQKLGHTVYNVTPTQQGLTLGQSLAARVNAANNNGVDLVISCHVNSFKTDQANGCEVEYKSSAGKVYADKIESELIKLGFNMHGSGSVQRNNLYVLNHTNAVAILVEPFFCDNKSDCALYNSRKIANAIIKGITGKDIYIDTPVPRPSPVAKAFDESIPSGLNITPLNGGIGYVETKKDNGRVIIHLDRYTYISMQNDGQNSHIDLYTRQESKRLL